MTYCGSPDGAADAVRFLHGITAPVDPDDVCAAIGAGITVHRDLPFLPAIRIGRQVFIRPGLSRPVERWWALHEAGHIALDSPDVDELDRQGRAAALDDDERAAQFAMQVLAPAWDVVERVEHGETLEDLAIEFGLTERHMELVIRSAYERVRNPFAA